MSSTIPISVLANVTPAVIGASGSGIQTTGLLLTSSTSVPIGAVQQFFSASAVSSFFGPSSAEYAFAQTYFQGPDGATQTPAYLLVAQFPVSGVAAYLESGAPVASLATLTAISTGTITLTLNGVAKTSANVNFNGATSYSQIAGILQTAIGFNDASFTGAITSNVLTVTSPTGTLAAGQTVVGAGVATGTTIVSQLSGTTGGAGTYQLSTTAASPITAESMTSGPLTVTYSSQLGAFVLTMGTPGTADTITVATPGTVATALNLTSATGAVVSPGSAAGVPATTMASIIAQNQNWVTFTTVFEPTSATKQAFSAWVNGQTDRYAYVCWSTALADATIGDTTGAFYAIQTAGYDATHLIYAPVNGALTAAFVMGAAASLNFNQTNGRRNFFGLSQSGLPADVNNLNTSQSLKTRGINYYGSFGNTSSPFNQYDVGTITGKFAYLDSFINQVWLNNALQAALISVLRGANGYIPYNTQGNTLIFEYLSGPIQNAVSFGAINIGVPLVPSQIASINALAGTKIDATLVQRGWALVIQPAPIAVRLARGSPPMLFFYTDGGSVQTLNLTSYEVQ